MTVDISRFQKEKTFEDFLHIIVKDFIFFIGPILLLLPIGLLATKGIKPMFQATASMYVTWGTDQWKGRIISSLVQEKNAAAGFFEDVETTLEKSKERFLDPAFSDDTVAIINGLIPNDPDRKKIINEYLRYIKSPKATLDAKTPKIVIETEVFSKKKEMDKRFFIIGINYKDSRLCKKTTNVFLSTVKEYFQLFYNQKENQRSSYMRKQLVYYKRKYDVARTVLDRYSQSKEMVFSSERYKRIKEILGFDPGVRIDNISYDKFKGDLIDLNLELKTLKARKKEIQDELMETEEYVISELIEEEDPQLAVLKEKLSEKGLLLAKLRIDSSSAHPLVQQTKEEIKNIEALVEIVSQNIQTKESKKINPTYEGLKERLSETNAQISAAKARIELNQLTLDDMRDKLEATKMVRSKIESLSRDVEETERLYKSFETKEREETLKASLVGEDAKCRIVTDFANRTKNLLIKKRIDIFAKYLFIGILTGIVILYARNARDSSYRTALELRKDLQIPVFGATNLIITHEEASKVKKIRKMVWIGYCSYLGIVLLLTFIKG